MEEVETILADLKEREGAQIANYFAAAFFGGFRPTEQVALCWDDVDFKQRNVRVARAVVRGKAKASTKTYLVRDVELSERGTARHHPAGWAAGILESSNQGAVGRHMDRRRGQESRARQAVEGLRCQHDGVGRFHHGTVTRGRQKRRKLNYYKKLCGGERGIRTLDTLFGRMLP